MPTHTPCVGRSAKTDRHGGESPVCEVRVGGHSMHVRRYAPLGEQARIDADERPENL